MSLITRCPACQTLFRVVPDQLRISEGWVRCGHCDEVFDASAHLFQEAQATPLAETPVQFSVAPPEPALTVDPLVGATARLVPEAETKTEPEAKTEAKTEALEAIAGEKVEPVLELGRIQEPTPPPVQEAPPALNADMPVALLPAAGDNDLPAVSFMRETSVESAWRRPLVRGVLGLASILLLLVLGLQVSLQERDRLAALHPQTRPVLQALCASLQCVLAPLRQIESIVIDNSSFAKIRGNAYRLNLSIRNSAAIEVAMPALELTLTDSQEQTVLRRVFSPAEFGAHSSVLAAGSEWSGGLAVNAVDVGSVDRITGYKVLAFYP